MNEPAGLYVHVPFCSAVCPYCDFAVRTGAAKHASAYVDALLAEIALWRDWSIPFDTIYFGGGTPSLLAAHGLSTVIDALRAALPFGDAPRIHFEANPEDVTPARAADWRALGVEFLSLGVQSFDDRALRFLGRRHDRAGAITAVERALEAGFETVSVDIMFGLPDSPLEALDETLGTLVALAPQHVSGYQLTVHEGTSFGRRRARGKFVELNDDAQADRFERVHETLDGAGWHAYEVSNFARAPEHRSRHNQKYWRHAPYLGLGPSAHSFDGRSRRWWNVRDLDAYATRIGAGERPVEGEERLDPEQLALEALMLGLRTVDGVSHREFENRFGVDLRRQNRARIATLVADGLLRADPDRLALTRAGLAVTDWVTARFDLQAVAQSPPPDSNNSRGQIS